MDRRLLLALAALAAHATAQTESPHGIKICADDQADVVECRRKALQEAIPLLAAGIPEMGAAPIDPLAQLPPLAWNTNSRGLALKFRLDNARFTGLGRSVVEKLQVDTDNKNIRVVTHIDGLNTLEGTYTLSGKVLGAPLGGNGYFNLTMHGGKVDVTYAGHLESGLRSQSYLTIDSVKVKLELGKSHYELSGLFGDYQPLVHAGNMFINSVAAKVVEPEILATLQKWLAQAYLERAQAVFSTVPYDQLFPKTSSDVDA